MCTRKISSPGAQIVLVLLLSAFITGCAGLRWWQKGDYFQMERDTTVAVDSIRRTAIYVYSDGRTRDGRTLPADVFDVLGALARLPFTIITAGEFESNKQVGLDIKFFPGRIDIDAELAPDSSNTGPSLELARAVHRELAWRGFRADVITSFGHASRIPVSDLIDHARNAGYDAAFVVYYSALSHWNQRQLIEFNTQGRMSLAQRTVVEYEGYLFIPNAVMYDTRSTGRIWSNSYYGAVENAHAINFSNQPFVRIATEALVHNGGTHYFEAAPKAARLLFNPKLWPDNHRDFPVRRTRTRRL